MSQITPGTYRARVSGECVLGESKDKKTPFLKFNLKIAEGEHKGSFVRWTGYFTENTEERTIQALLYCGWQGDDLNEFSDGQLHGLDSNEVDVVVEIEEYKKDGETKHAPRVAWINRPGGYLNREAAMNTDAARGFGERMRGLVTAMRAKTPVKDQSASFDHGANAPGGGAATPRKAF